MKKRIFTRFIAPACALFLFCAASGAAAKPAEFGDVVKLVESHYGVRHKSAPLLARAGLKAGEMVARRLTRYTEYGSLKFAVFEDQDFRARAETDFAAALRDKLRPDWEPLVETANGGGADQTYIYTREHGKFFRVLVVTIAQRDATAVEAQVAPQKLMLLMKDPDEMGKTLNDEATEDTQQ